ncbi:hypothetical protein LOTGIDRAFT_162798 [Lottia gigantea]|uniref:Uncharacterized protein n=1 Tax=Lottia gigantea TaxID=225164 RepID=V4A5Z3_LOTGI|nr:hypothetical protein LOTGIDRAFT_162798 [Lottia gigantea]ESO92147.1 hypothetical protein LOTGIDRAFT_162798 [Lottia gigantea]
MDKTTDSSPTVYPTLDGASPAVSTNKSNNVIIVTVTLGGILAGVIIINIVGIALYCFIRRHKKQQTTRKALANGSGNGEQSQYDYIDFIHDTNGCNSTNKTGINMVQNDNQRQNNQYIELLIIQFKYLQLLFIQCPVKMKSVVCLMVFLSISTDSDGLIEQYCNEPLCFLCGCGDKSVFNISCEDKNDIILMEHGGYRMREGEYDSDDCPLDSYETCKESNSTSILNNQDRIEVYKNCMLKHSCEINIQERLRTGKKRWVNYPFACYPKSFLIDLSNEINKNVELPMFYFSGEKLNVNLNDA